MRWRATGPVVTIADVKLCDKCRALELAATYLGLLKKQVERSGGIDLVKRLQAAGRLVRAPPREARSLRSSPSPSARFTCVPHCSRSLTASA